MAEFPSLPLWTDAYLADTRHLSTVEHGAYLLLLMEAWRRPTCSLPDDDRLLARLAGISDVEWSHIKDQVLNFWAYDGRRKEWKQLRLVKERDFVANKSRSQRDRILSRWNKTEKTLTGAIPDGIPDRYPADTPTPTTKIKDNSLRSLSKNDKKNGCRIPKDFEPDRDWSNRQGLNGNELRFEFDQFKDFWAAASGAKARKKDWQATWRTWIRNAVKRKGQTAKSKTVGEGFAELAKNMGLLHDDKSNHEQAGLFAEGEQGRNGAVLDLVVDKTEPQGSECSDFTSRLLHRP